jgi:hypothetical protein
MPAHPDEVYRSENLRFATKEAGRLPTLYFRTSHGSGRLRQQHDDGPYKQPIRKHTSHAFFATEELRNRFIDEFHTTTMTRGDFRTTRAKYGGKHTPTQDYYHFEATFDKHGSDGKMKRDHPSGGTVVSGQYLEELRTKVPQIYSTM